MASKKEQQKKEAFRHLWLLCVLLTQDLFNTYSETPHSNLAC